MGFLDKLRGKKEEPKPEPLPSELSAWIAGVMQRLEPSRVQFQPGETLGDVLDRVFAEEERLVRASANDPLQARKLEALRALRRQFGDEAAAPKEEKMSTPANGVHEAAYEMTLGGEQELSGVPLSMLLQVISGWRMVVDLVGRQQRVSEDDRDAYRRVMVRTEPAAQGEEMIALFLGTKEMIQLFRSKMKEAGLDPGA